MKRWRPVHWLAVSVLALAALAIGGLVYLNRVYEEPGPQPQMASANQPGPQAQTSGPDRPDPQEQIGLRWIKAEGAEAEYVGSDECRACHQAEFQSYAASTHARTLHRIPEGQERAEFGSNQTVTDELDGILYAVRRWEGNNQVIATLSSGKDGANARWTFGSGTHAWTYLAQSQDRFLQLRITYYPAARSWNFTPGSGPGQGSNETLGDPYTPGQAAACFGCHSTVLSGSRQHLDLDRSRLNVGCESCHGPGRAHVQSMQNTAASAPMVTPPEHTGPEIMQLCGACHRVPVEGSDAIPGENPLLARFPGEALPRSRCFIASAGKLSCITCHNPHESTAQQGEASFVRACLGCHTAPHGTPCTLGKTSGCINCHMPAEQITRKLPLFFHNHWIRKRAPAVT